MRGLGFPGFGRFRIDSAAAAPPSTSELRMSQFFLEVSLSRESILPPAPASPCSGGGTVAGAADPVDGVDLATSRTPLIWVVLHLDTGDRAYSYVPLPDPSTYHAGYKEPRIISIGRIRRAMSDRFGGLQTSTCDLVLIDTDRHIRARMSAETLLNREWEIWMADDATRRAQGLARRVGHFAITAYEPIGDFTFRISGADFIGAEVSKFFAEQVIDLPKFSRTYFQQLPQVIEGTTIPGYYGNVSDESLPTSEFGPVVLDPTLGVGGGTVDGVFPEFGWVDDIPVAAPASLSVSQSTGGAFADGTYYLLVTAIVDGLESLPYPVDGSGVSLAVTGGGGSASIVGDTPDVPGASAYRWYLSDAQVAAHVSPGVMQIFKATTLSTVTITGPTDGTPYLNYPMWAAVVAKMADGVTVPQRSITNDTGVTQYEGFVKLAPSVGRPTRIGWVPLADALEYWVYLRGPDTGSYFGAPDAYTMRFIVDPDQDRFDFAYGMVGEKVPGLPGTEQELGAVPWPYVGEWLCPDGVTRSAFVGATGTLGNIQSLFGSDGVAPTPERHKIPDSLYGTVVFAPRKTGWLYPTHYVQVTSSEGDPLWLTMIFVDSGHPIATAAKDGTVPITGNICGWTTHGDGTGNTISSGPRQVLHMLTNFGPREDGSWRSGEWKAIPVRNGVPVYRSSSFEGVKTQTEGIIDGGFECAWGLGVTKDAPNLYDFLAAAAINLHIRWCTSAHGDWLMRMLDTDAGAAAAFSDRTATIPDHAVPVITPSTEDLINKFRWVFKQNYIESVTKQTPGEAELLPPELAETPGWYSGQLEDTDLASKNEHKTPWKPVDLQFAMHRDIRAPRAVVQRMKAMLAWPRDVVRFPGSLLGMDIELGDVVTFTHEAGSGASGATERRIYVSAIELEAQMDLGAVTTFDTWIEGEDITDLVLGELST